MSHHVIFTAAFPVGRGSILAAQSWPAQQVNHPQLGPWVLCPRHKQPPPGQFSMCTEVTCKSCGAFPFTAVFLCDGNDAEPEQRDRRTGVHPFPHSTNATGFFLRCWSPDGVTRPRAGCWVRGFSGMVWLCLHPQGILSVNIRGAVCLFHTHFSTWKSTFLLFLSIHLRNGNSKF